MDDPRRTRPHWTLFYIVGAAVGLAAILALATAPTAELLGDSQHAIPGTLHGISAILYVVIATVLAYLGYQLYTDRLRSYHDLRILAGLSAFFSLVTVLFGNWIYIYYRQTGGPRSYFLETNPVVHEVFFEFKEFVALFTLPLAVAAAIITLREGDQLASRPLTRQVLAVLFGLGWLLLMVSFGLGAAITRLRGV